jgi:hypothetical protein
MTACEHENFSKRMGSREISNEQTEADSGTENTKVNQSLTILICLKCLSTKKQMLYISNLPTDLHPACNHKNQSTNSISSISIHTPSNHTINASTSPAATIFNLGDDILNFNAHPLKTHNQELSITTHPWISTKNERSNLGCPKNESV